MTGLRPTIFVSSTIYDLRDLRDSVQTALRNAGFTVLASEDGSIPVESSRHSYEVCLEAARNCDCLVAVIDGRFGGTMPDGKTSITQAEVEAALDRGRQVYVFVRQAVWEAKEVYRAHAKAGYPFVASKVVDDERVFQVIDAIRTRARGNWIFQFNKPSDLIGTILFQLRSHRSSDSKTSLRTEANPPQAPFNGAGNGPEATPQSAKSGKLDLGVITVIGPELYAVQDVLSVHDKTRLHRSGTIYWQGRKYSQLMDRDLSFVVTCAADASQASASTAVAKLIKEFDPTFLILVGIAAGWRGKLRIGDIVVPKAVVDFSVRVAEGGEEKPRPVITTLPPAVSQMYHAFRLDRNKLVRVFSTLFGAAIKPRPGQEKEFAENVTFEPSVHDSVLASADLLLRDPSKFAEFAKIHQGIRASEMEAGGFIRGCKTVSYPEKPWLVVRGISDLGDELKNDDFHRLASCAAAAFLDVFLSDGLDLGVFGCGADHDTEVPMRSRVQNLQLSQEQESAGETRLSGLTASIINGQLEKLSQSLSDAALTQIENIRDLWNTGNPQSAVAHLTEMKKGEAWRFLKPETRFRILRLQASFLLNVDHDVEQVRAILQEASKEGDAGKLKGLEALICLQEGASDKALEIVGSPQNLESWNVRLAILLQLGRPAVLAGEFNKPPAGVIPDVESKRLYALALLHINNVETALRIIDEAKASQPRWFAVRFVWAVIAYFSSLSPALLKATPKHWPAPCDTGLVKRDRETLIRLRASEETFSSLLTNDSLNAELRVELEGWKLASFANHAERQTEAAAYCVELLEKNPKHPVAMQWAIVRDYPVDVSQSINALAAEVEENA